MAQTDTPHGSSLGVLRLRMRQSATLAPECGIPAYCMGCSVRGESNDRTVQEHLCHIAGRRRYPPCRSAGGLRAEAAAVSSPRHDCSMVIRASSTYLRWATQRHNSERAWVAFGDSVRR